MLRASQMEPTSARQSIVSPGSPTGKLLRTRKQNEALQAELHRLQDAFEDIDDRNQALIKEKEDVSQRLSEVQEKLHQETEGYFEQSAYAKSMAQQLQEEQQKVLRLRRAVDNMELDVCQPARHVCVFAQPALVSSVN
jgi:chromosome segregation ATPase